MTPPRPNANQPPNDGPFSQPISRLDELLADRAVQGLSEGEEVELRRLLAVAGKAEDRSFDFAAAASSSALFPHDQLVEMPASLLAALDREGEAWCGGVHSHDDEQVAGRIVHPRTGRMTDVGQGHLLRTPFKRFTREYGGWLAAAACLSFGVYAWNSRNAPVTNVTDPGKAIVGGEVVRPIENAALSLRQRAMERLNRWFNTGQAPDIVPLGSATPDSGTDVAVGQVMWNAEEGTGVLKINGLDDSKASANRTYRVSVCSKNGKRVPLETGSITLHPGQKDVLVPIDSREIIRDAAAFVVSVCSPGPMGVSQSEGVVGFGGALSEPTGGQSELESN
jgi:hypothetical protein